MAAGFLALGDSYTIGEGVAVTERWPVQLAARLRESGVEIGDPKIVAKTGWTTDELSAAMDAETFAPPYALVSLLVGVNNQYRGRPLAEYRVEFRGLLQRAIALADGDAAKTLVVSIPDWGVTPFARAEGRDAHAVAGEIDLFNAAACAETERAGARWIDVTTLSRSPAARDELVADGLHPSGVQYARWAEVIVPVAATMLRRA